MQTQAASDFDLRRTILDTTRSLLVSEGYKSLSMRRIARAMGYSATSIYLYFESKEALFHSLIEEGMEKLQQSLTRAAAHFPDDPVGRLRALCREYLEFGLGNAEYYEIMFVLHSEYMGRFPAEKFRQARRNLQIIAATLSDGIEKGIMEADDPYVAASVLWSSLHGAVSLILTRRVDSRIDERLFIETVVHQAVDGLVRMR